MLRESEKAKQYVAKLERKYNKGKALGMMNLAFLISSLMRFTR